MAAAVLRELLGHAAFRPYQEACIARLLAADDVLAILPTGGGKSVIYQVPALLRHAQDPELQCLVVAPLVSLIADQMSALNARLRLAAGGIRPRAGGPGGPVAARFAPGARAPFLFITPEALRGAHEAVGALRLSLLVVDEAHCISAHGRAFREAYRELTCLRALHPTVPLCALTATASAGVGRDVALQLGLRGAPEVRAPLDRANLRLSVVSRRQLADDVGALLGHLSAGQGIVYFPTQREVERGAQLLAARGLDVAAYHAGLDAAVRQAVQERFVAGTLQCMAATLAFGMGVDVPGVRCIVHYGLPGALESYVQEIGRAGRDGAPAACVLFWTGADACTRTRLAQSSLDPALAGQGLREMLAFVQAGRCLRQQLAEKFGDAATGPCSARGGEVCGNCAAPPGQYAEYGADARALLRTVQLVHAGATKQLDYHCGHAGKDVQELRQKHGGLLCGSGAHRPLSWWKALHERLRSAGYVTCNVHGAYTLAPPGLEALAEDDVPVVLPEIEVAAPRGSKRPAPAPAAGPAPAGRAALLELRAAQAKLQKCQPYLIFNNQVLDNLLTARPDSEAALLRVAGIGPAKVSAYGRLILAALGGARDDLRGPA